MNVTITPSRALGTVQAPPSKSMAHRALICGALSPNSTVTDLAFSKDIEATLGCLSSLGVPITRDGTAVTLGGFSTDRIPDNAQLFCNESGSTLRFLLPLCMAAGKSVTLYGSTRLFERPLSVYEELAAKHGIVFEKGIDRVRVCGTLKSGDYCVPGDISSQFISGLLFVLPLLGGDSTLTITGRFESASYVDLTLAVLADFGVTVTRENHRFVIPGNQRPCSCNYGVEGDCSNAAFLDALNYVGGNVTVRGLASDTLQGDRVYADLFERLRHGETDLDLSDCPDLAPICFAVAAVLHGARFTGTARLRIKESDRAASMAEELQKFGITVCVQENAVAVHKGILTTPSKKLYGHNDHRIVMALTVLCTVTGGTITQAEAVTKSFPDFFEVMKALKVGVSIDEIE